MDILITKQAQDDLDAIEKNTVIKFLQSQKLKEVPLFQLGAKKLAHPLKPLYRIREGDYRMLYKLEGETITIMAVKHRKEAYKPQVSLKRSSCVRKLEKL
ncbi:MAG: type II toxin-antitoxin system RelE/ParE family toxin [Firmicutes bacterium]|nr:type II toxin-antitoxin system RelE/ParE family toxin [Bacillota bacterium]